MVAAAKNYDVICLNMRSYMPRQEDPIKLETNRFINGVKAIVAAGTPIKPKLDKFLPRIFDFRIHALQWIGRQQGINLGDLIGDTYPAMEALTHHPKLAVLAENALFALRCNQRVVRAFLAAATPGTGNLSTMFGETPTITYNHFTTTLLWSIPDEELAQNLLEFTRCSLYIEFILLATILIAEEGLDVSEDTVGDLAFLIADAAQTYGALATILGILPRRKPSVLSQHDVTPIDSEEDRFLANLDLSEFDKIF